MTVPESASTTTLLPCPGSSSIQSIDFASYSPTTACTCADTMPVNEVSVLTRLCVGKQQCFVEHPNSFFVIFGDPCVNCDKQLSVQWR